MSGDTIISLIFKAGLVVKFVLLLLLFFSVVSWAIIIYKQKLLSKIAKETDEFNWAYAGSRDWDSVHESTKNLVLSPLAHLFRTAHSMKDAEKDEIRRSLRRVEVIETSGLEKNLTFLATTGSTAPFIGLFGTVWGIMNSFMGIGRVGSASLAVVAPGIAEALIATAAGLAAAIPAVIAYNYYLSRANINITMMEDFSLELIEHRVRENAEAQTGTF